MKPSLTLKLTLCMLLVFAVFPLSAYQMPQPFSADMTSTMANGDKMTGKWHFSAPAIRIDMTSVPRNSTGGPFSGNMSMIIDGAKQTTYVLMPQQQMYMEFHGERQRNMPSLRDMLLMKGADPCSGDPDTTCKKLGAETVNGRVCDKREVTHKTHGTRTEWVDQKLHFPIKMQGSEGYVTEFTNIKEGAQDPSLFKVPDGYRPFSPGAFGQQPK